ncbi:hypothetical protein Hlac_2935 [Halorubrum lacusprofundi ATCC 49239]|jgi:hypothetical protein|uniref:Uncharacterized protein n=2 Tax=Halorubrum lacusprofundi TaxID=2247 RepID=B9LW97_HALLT|nr:hypothetical protein Hlac_2935 [Halorubrum lacusprofundi ATCC 49239]
MILVVTLDMALHNPFREASRLLREQLLLSVPMTVTAVHQTPQLFFEILPPVISLGRADETSSRSNATTADRCSNGFVNPHLSQ